MQKRVCRFCGEQLTTTFADLGMSPLSNSFLCEKDLYRAEMFFPLHAFVCKRCLLVQVIDAQKPDEIFSDYSYFSSYSSTWLGHAQKYAVMATERFHLNKDSRIIEIASNDGYLLQYFQRLGIPVLGIEPAANIALVAKKKGIPTKVDFFGTRLAHELNANEEMADLVIGNNVLAHVPDINDFVAGMKVIMKPKGTITMEFPHLLNLIIGNQFDTIYHEHFSYISLNTAIKIFEAKGLKIYDVEELPIHGGSLRIYACHTDDIDKGLSTNVTRVLNDEKKAGLTSLDTYEMFPEKVKKAKYSILKHLINIKQGKKEIVGYGAPAKGNTLLNYCGIRSDFISYTVDKNPYKQGKYLPGTHIPVFAPEKIMETKPDYVFILPWNLKDEIIEQMSFIRDWGGKFIIPIPEIEVI